MKYYDEKQLDILRLLNNNEYIKVTNDLTEQCIYLVREQLIRTQYENFPDGRYKVARITQAGKAYIRTLEETTLRYQEPLKVSKRANYISVVAIIIALISLLKSSGIF